MSDFGRCVSHHDSLPRTRSYTNERRFLDISKYYYRHEVPSGMATVQRNAECRQGEGKQPVVAFACIAVAARTLARGRHLSFAFRIDLSLSSILTGQLDDVQSSIWCDLVSWSIERPFANNKLGGAYRPSAIKTCTRLATPGSPPPIRFVVAAT